MTSRHDFAAGRLRLIGRGGREKRSNLVDVRAERGQSAGRLPVKRGRIEKTSSRRNALFTITKEEKALMPINCAEAHLARSLARKWAHFATSCCRIFVVEACRLAAARLHHNLQLASASSALGDSQPGAFI